MGNRSLKAATQWSMSMGMSPNMYSTGSRLVLKNDNEDKRYVRVQAQGKLQSIINNIGKQLSYCNLMA